MECQMEPIWTVYKAVFIRPFGLSHQNIMLNATQSSVVCKMPIFFSVGFGTWAFDPNWEFGKELVWLLTKTSFYEFWAEIYFAKPFKILLLIPEIWTFWFWIVQLIIEAKKINYERLQKEILLAFEHFVF